MMDQISRNQKTIDSKNISNFGLTITTLISFITISIIINVVEVFQYLITIVIYLVHFNY